MIDGPVGSILREMYTPFAQGTKILIIGETDEKAFTDRHAHPDFCLCWR